jgi:hypothetical protein
MAVSCSGPGVVMQLPRVPDRVGSITRRTPVALFTHPWNVFVPGSGIAATAIPVVTTAATTTAATAGINRRGRR